MQKYNARNKAVPESIHYALYKQESGGKLHVL